MNLGHDITLQHKKNIINWTSKENPYRGKRKLALVGIDAHPQRVAGFRGYPFSPAGGGGEFVHSQRLGGTGNHMSSGIPSNLFIGHKFHDTRMFSHPQVPKFSEDGRRLHNSFWEPSIGTHVSRDDRSPHAQGMESPGPNRPAEHAYPLPSTYLI